MLSSITSIQTPRALLSVSRISEPTHLYIHGSSNRIHSVSSQVLTAHSILFVHDSCLAVLPLTSYYRHFVISIEINVL